MPRAPKPCTTCGALVTGGRSYCTEHQPAHKWTAYPSARNTKTTRAEQQAFRSAVLAREPQCRICGSPATEADHIVPIARGGTNDPATNGQGLCSPHHATKTRADRRER